MSIVALANKYKVHHLKNIESKLKDLIYVDSYNYDEIIKHNPKLVIVFDEHWCELGNVVGSLVSNNIPVLQIMDGILEWRRTWDYGWNGHKVDGVINPINQPALAHKIACLGYKDYRILESWGNQGKCEVVGVARFKELINYRKDFSHVKEKENYKVLIVTAKTPYFTEKQKETTVESLNDLKEYFSNINKFQVTWRISPELSKIINVKNEMNDLTGMELHEILKKVDIVISTPSTTILEAQLIKIPVITLDYHNKPHYFETAWSIFSKKDIPLVLKEVSNPKKELLEYQNFLINDQVYLKENPDIRLLKLIESMIKTNINEYQYGILNNFPIYKKTINSDYTEYYEKFSVQDMDIEKLKIELSAAKGTISQLYEKNSILEKKLDKIPFYSFLKKIKDLVK